MLRALALPIASAIAACGSDGANPARSGPDPSNREGGPGAGPDGAGADGGRVDGAEDAAKKDGDSLTDGAVADDGGIIMGGDPPAVQLVGRFEKVGASARFAFPGSKVIARFKGAAAVVTLSQTDGFTAGHSWFNVVVDGVLQSKIEVNGASVAYPVATNLDPNLAHTVEIEKRTEGNLGVVQFEGFAFPGGGVLLGPPLRPARRIEFLSDSTIDGFGIEGDRRNTAPAASYCGDPLAADLGAPARFNNARKSMSVLTAAALSAEPYQIGRAHV